MAMKEVCISARDRGIGRAQAGDVIVVRNPKGGIGRQEGRNYLWLLIDESELANIVTINNGPAFKYRNNIPLAALKTLYPDLDLTRVADNRDWYQPFRDTDEDIGAHRRNRTPSGIAQILTDKELL